MNQRTVLRQYPHFSLVEPLRAGDIVTHKSLCDRYIIARCSSSGIVAINLKSGCRVADAVHVEDHTQLTLSEAARVLRCCAPEDLDAWVFEARGPRT